MAATLGRNTTVKFMLIRKADDDTETGAMPSAELIAAMTEYNEALMAAGVLRAGEGLQPSNAGARVSFTAGQPVVTDGPFSETKELIAGFTVIEVASREEAIEWARRWPAIDGGGNVQLEIRQVAGDDDFGDEFTPALRDREQAMRDKLGT